MAYFIHDCPHGDASILCGECMSKHHDETGHVGEDGGPVLHTTCPKCWERMEAEDREL